MASTFILTSAPLLPSQVPLGSFVPDISQPYADVKRLVTVSQSDYSVRPDIDFSGIVNISSESLLQILATRFANLLVRRDQGSTFQVEAERGNLYTLDHPSDLFTTIMTSEEHGQDAKRWLEQCKMQGLAPRFVVGYRTFANAKLSRGEQASSDVRAELTAPTGSLQGDVSGVVDIKASAAHKASHVIQGEATLTGERVYAIAYRKVRVKIRQGVISGTLDLKTAWEPFSGTRGGDGTGSIYLQADASSADDGDGCEVVLVRSELGRDDEPVRLALGES